MKNIPLVLLSLFLSSPSSLFADAPVNPHIQYSEFQKLTISLGPAREKNRISEDDFIKFSSEPKTVILDARSRDKFEKTHVKGALHLAFTDFTEDALKKVIPDKTTRILIYCNNNFDNEPVVFAGKFAPVAPQHPNVYQSPRLRLHQRL